MLNDLILGEFETEHYFTLLLAVIDTETGEVDFTQAGHPSPLIQRYSGETETIGDGGLPVGLIEEAGFESGRARLFPGDRLLIYSDGLTECTNPRGEFFGEEGLIAALGNLWGRDGPDSLTSLVSMLEEFHGPRAFEDDISAALVDMRPLNPSTT